MVSTSPMPFTLRVKASRICVASVVKRLAWRAGASAETTAKSARVRATKRLFCTCSMLRSTAPCMVICWRYMKPPRAAVTAMMSGGSRKITRSSPRLNMSKLCWMMMG